MTGVALPSSSSTFLRAARSRSFQPTSAEPVKLISFTRSSSTQTSPIVGGRPDDDVEPARREPRFQLELGQGERGERSLAGRLQHDRAPGRECGRDLVGDEVERKVERRDGGDDPERHAHREAQLSRAGR